MSQLILNAGTQPNTPSSGKATNWLDQNAKRWFERNDTGRHFGITYNAAVAAQGAGFAADTYVLGSDLMIPSFGLQPGTQFKWMISASKTAAGIAGPIYQVRIGAARSTGDTSRLTLTGMAQTAAVDIGIFTLILTVRSVSASGVIAGSMNIDHNGATAGFASNNAAAVEGNASFDNSALAGLYIGLSINGGASAAWTLTQVLAEAKW